MTGKNPSTPAEWQEAVDGADLLLRIHSAVLYGLITTNLQIDAERCSVVLKQGAALGYSPDPRVVEKAFGKAS